MYKLAILAIHDPASKMEDREIVGQFEYETSSQAELRALRWLMYCPNDIVMLITPECVHCGAEVVDHGGDYWAHATGLGRCQSPDVEYGHLAHPADVPCRADGPNPCLGAFKGSVE